jgi:hypothetical protein
VAVVLKMLASRGIEDAKRVKKSKYLRDLISVFLEIGVTNGVVQCQLPESAQKVAQLKMLEPKSQRKIKEKSKVQKKK